MRSSEAPYLTPREGEVAMLVREGLSNVQIARKLKISPQTIKYHLKTIYLKFGFRGRLQLAIHMEKGGHMSYDGANHLQPPQTRQPFYCDGPHDLVAVPTGSGDEVLACRRCDYVNRIAPLQRSGPQAHEERLQK